MIWLRMHTTREKRSKPTPPKSGVPLVSGFGSWFLFSLGAGRRSASMDARHAGAVSGLSQATPPAPSPLRDIHTPVGTRVVDMVNGFLFVGPTVGNPVSPGAILKVYRQDTHIEISVSLEKDRGMVKRTHFIGQGTGCRDPSGRPPAGLY